MRAMTDVLEFEPRRLVRARSALCVKRPRPRTPEVKIRLQDRIDEIVRGAPFLLDPEVNVE